MISYGVYGQFSSIVDQAIASVTTAQAVAFEVEDYKKGITHSNVTNNSRIQVNEAGIYLVIASMQCSLSSGSNKVFDFWFAKNGTNIAASNFRHFVDAASTESLASLNILLSLAKDDYIELFMVGDSTNLLLDFVAAGASPTRPTTPSVILTINQISR
jgi:hypothetical protein